MLMTGGTAQLLGLVPNNVRLRVVCTSWAAHVAVATLKQGLSEPSFVCPLKTVAEVPNIPRVPPYRYDNQTSEGKPVKVKARLR
jgi:hypothetical protein